MSKWSALLKEASIRMIEARAEDSKAKEKVDLEVITFNTEEQVCVKIEAQELYNLVDETTGKIKPDFEQRLQFNCSGATPTAYALAVAVDDLRNRYEKLKKSSKAPKSPILFVLSDGLPEVQDDIRVEHDKLLAEQLARIKQLVRENTGYAVSRRRNGKRIIFPKCTSSCRILPGWTMTITSVWRKILTTSPSSLSSRLLW